MREGDALWSEVYAAFKEHKVEQTPEVNLNRIAGKCIIGNMFGPSNCTIHEETLSLEDMKQLKLYSRDEANPHWDVEPIVVLVYQGQRFVIDGRRRVMKWLNEGIDTPRRALVIEPLAS